MASYRFCRTDDVQLLVDAYNRCWQVDDGAPPMTVDAFRRAMRELDIWCSSCMVAHDGADPVAVLLAGKRESENLIYALGVHRDHRRGGHGRHLLTSLSAKLAILGPPRLVAEVPADWTEARAFLEACGYRAERQYFDWERSAEEGSAAGPAEPGADLVVSVAVDDLDAAGVLQDSLARCWERAPQSLFKRKDQTEGLAITSDRIEAYLLYRDSSQECRREIVAFGCAEPERRAPMLGLLFRRCVRAQVPWIRVSRVWDGEISSGELESWGFRRARGYVGLATHAVPA